MKIKNIGICIFYIIVFLSCMSPYLNNDISNSKKITNIESHTKMVLYCANIGYMHYATNTIFLKLNNNPEKDIIDIKDLFNIEPKSIEKINETEYLIIYNLEVL